MVHFDTDKITLAQKDVVQKKYFRQETLWAILLLAFLAPTASAGFIVRLDSITASIVFPGDYEWTYSALVDPTDGLTDNGNVYFTIYDLPGNITTVEAASDWQAFSAKLGRTPYWVDTNR